MSALTYSPRSCSPSSSSSSAELSTSSSSSPESSSSDSNSSSSGDYASSRSPSPARVGNFSKNRRNWPASNYPASSRQDGPPNSNKRNCLDVPSTNARQSRWVSTSSSTTGSDASRKKLSAEVDKELRKASFAQCQRRSERIFLADAAPGKENPATLHSRRSWSATREQNQEIVTFGPAAIYSGGGYKYFRYSSSKVKGHIFLFRRATHIENDGAFKCTACLKVATSLELSQHLVKSVRVMNGLIASDPEARHICLRSSNGTVQPRTSNGCAKPPPYTKKDCVDEVYDPITTAGPGVVSYYSGMYSSRLEFRLLGDSKHVPGVQEYYCTACRNVDKNYTCIVCVKDGHFVAVDPDYSYNGHACIKAANEVGPRAGPVTRQTSVKSTVAKQAPKRKSPAAVTHTDKTTPNGSRTRLSKLPVKSPGRAIPSGSKTQDFGKAHFNANGEVQWKSRVHKGKTLRFVFHAHVPATPVCYYRCDACHELCAKYKSAGALPRMLSVSEDEKLMRNPDDCGTTFGHLCQMPKKVAELQARQTSPKIKKSRLDSPALQDHEFSAGIDANVDDVAENFEDLLDNLDSLLSPEAGAEGDQYENDVGAGVVNFIATPSAGPAAGPQNAGAPANMAADTEAPSIPAAASEDRKPDISALRRQQQRSSVTNISLHPDDDDEIQFLGVTHPERRQSSQLPEIKIVGVTPGQPSGKQKTTSAPSAAAIPPPPAREAPAAVPPAPTAAAPTGGLSSATSAGMLGKPSTSSVASSRQAPACVSSGATAGAGGDAQVARDLNRIDDDEILLLDLENILEDQTPWTHRRVKQEVKQEAACHGQQHQVIPPVMASKPPSGYVTNFGKAHFSPDGTFAFFTDILGMNYTFEQLEMLSVTANGEQIETRIYQCKTCMEAASRLGISVDFPRVKTVNGYFVDTDPGRPRGNVHLCTRNPNN